MNHPYLKKILRRLALRKEMRPLPVWFCDRMMSDHWRFALLLSTGHELRISTIRAVTQAADGTIWIDVKMEVATDGEEMDERILVAPTSRTTASVNCAHIVAAWEIADT